MPRTQAADVCPCGAPVEAAYQRHATEAEYNALPEGLKPIDGVAWIAVRVCGDCHPGPICEHPDNGPVPCPDCHAQPGQRCVKPDGTPRAAEHRARIDAQPVIELCRHAHRETCTDPRACACTGQDEPPARIPRTFTAPTANETLTGLGFPPEMLTEATAWLHRNRIDPALIRGQVRTGLTQDNRPAILFDYTEPGPGGAPVVDQHGHEEVALRIVPIDGTQG